MRIVFASYAYTRDFNDPAAWIKRIKGYVGIQEALGKRHEVISIEQIGYEGEFKEDDVHYYFKRYSKVERRLPYRMHRFIKSLKPDVVFIHGLHFSLQVIQLRLHLGNNVKVIAQHHAELPFVGIKKRLQWLASKYVDAYLFASRDMGTTWVNMGNLKTIEKIHEVMEVSSLFYPVERIKAASITEAWGNPVFLWVGGLHQRKDPLNMVKAFLRYAEINPLARLYIIHQTNELLGEISALLAQCSRYRESIVLVGKVNHQDLLYWYSSADFIVSSSLYEGSGTAVCEAMSCGCIPVLTAIDSFRMMTDDGKCGVLYKAGDEDALVSALVQAQQMNMPEMSKRSLAFFNAHLSTEAIAARIEQAALNLF